MVRLYMFLPEPSVLGLCNSVTVHSFVAARDETEKIMKAGSDWRNSKLTDSMSNV